LLLIVTMWAKKGNISNAFKLEIITTYHMICWKYYENFVAVTLFFFYKIVLVKEK